MNNKMALSAEVKGLTAMPLQARAQYPCWKCLSQLSPSTLSRCCRDFLKVPDSRTSFFLLPMIRQLQNEPEGNWIASMGLCYCDWPKAKPTSSHPQDRPQFARPGASFFQMT
jgi:hypothetical protein